MNSKNFLKISTFYTITNGINRASTFIYIPFLISFLSLEDFGNFTLIQSIAQFLVPILLISSTSGVIRESSKGDEHSYLVYKTFSLYILIIVAILISTLFVDTNNMYIYSIYIAASLGIHELNLAWFKVKDAYYLFILQVMFKVVSLLVLFSFANPDISLIQILKLQFVILLIIGIIFQLISIGWKYSFNPRIFKRVISYTIFIIPHGMGIWALSSSDKIIIKYVLSDYELGLYSLGYSIAMILVFFNAGLASTLPQIIAKNYHKIDIIDLGRKTIKSYSFASAILFLLILSGIIIDKNSYNLIKYYSTDLYLIIFFAFLGIYFMGLYYFYSYFLIYFRKTQRLAKVTILSSTLSICLTTILCFYVGIVGAAISTSISYLVFFFAIYVESNKLEPTLNETKSFLIRSILITSSIILILFIIFLRIV